MQSRSTTPNAPPRRSLIVVSGLPRSGTSMMMQMLAAGGLPLLTDGLRVADADNPRGYFEFGPVKRIREDATFIEDAVGRVVKVVAPLLPWLPEDFDYSVLFMERALPEVLASQRAMMRRSSQPVEYGAEAALERAFARELDHVKSWLASRRNVETCFVSHRETTRRPLETARRVAGFLDDVSFGGAEIQRMAAAVEPALHRQRGEA